MEFGLKEVLAILGVILGPSGAVWVAVKGSLNGTRRRVENTERDVLEIKKGVDDIKEMFAKQCVDYEHRFTVLEMKS